MGYVSAVGENTQRRRLRIVRCFNAVPTRASKINFTLLRINIKLSEGQINLFVIKKRAKI